VWACVWLLLPTEIRMSDPENSFSDAENNELLVEEKEDSDETDDELIELMIKWISKPDSPDLVQPVRRGVLEHLVVSPVPDFSLPEVLESVPPMGAGYVSPVARYRRYRPVDFLWEPREPDSDEESEEEYVPVYRLPWWHLAIEVPENDGTWEEVLSPEQTRPSTPVELSANANSPIPPDEGFGEFPPTDRALTFNGGLWHYGKRLAVTEKGWILPPCCSAHLCRRPSALSRHAYESVTFVCRRPEVVYAHATGPMVKKIQLYAGLNILVWCVADLQFDYCGAFDVKSRFSGRRLYSTNLCFRAEGDTCWRYYYSPMYQGRFPFLMQHGYTEVYPGEEDPSCAVYITAIGQVPTLQQMARARLGYNSLRMGAYTALGERLRRGLTWNDGAIRHTILLLSTRRVKVKGWWPAQDQIIYS